MHPCLKQNLQGTMKKNIYIYYNNRVTDKDRFYNYLKYVVTLTTGGH